MVYARRKQQTGSTMSDVSATDLTEAAAALVLESPTNASAAAAEETADTWLASLGDAYPSEYSKLFKDNGVDLHFLVGLDSSSSLTDRRARLLSRVAVDMDVRLRLHTLMAGTPQLNSLRHRAGAGPPLGPAEGRGQGGGMASPPPRAPAAAVNAAPVPAASAARPSPRSPRFRLAHSALVPSLAPSPAKAQQLQAQAAAAQTAAAQFAAAQLAAVTAAAPSPHFSPRPHPPAKAEKTTPTHGRRARA